MTGTGRLYTQEVSALGNALSTTYLNHFVISAPTTATKTTPANYFHRATTRSNLIGAPVASNSNDGKSQ